jgi:hypothetical protein
MAAAIMALTLAPYLAGAGAQDGAWRFSGFLLAVEDGHSYIAKMLQGAQGAWLYRLPYTSEPQAGAPLNWFYLLLGKLAGTEHAALVTAFHGARLLAGALMLLVTYRFLAEFVPQPALRRLGLLVVALGGGLGWLITLLFPAGLLGSLPVDFISPEAFSFLILFSLPHLALARALLLLAMLAYLHGRGWRAGLALLGVALIQPLAVAGAAVVVALDLIVGALARKAKGGGALVEPRRKLGTALTAGLVAAPVFACTAYAFAADPILRQWLAQNQLPSPHPLHYALAYGLWLAPAALGLRWLWRCDRRLAVFAAAWVLAAAALLYAPISTQRRAIEGVQAPVAGLAMAGLGAARPKARRWAMAGLALTLPTTALLWVGALRVAARPAEPVFVPAGQAAVFAWLRENGQPGDVALGAFATGNALPAYAPLTAYIGHGPETIGLAAKRPRVEAFYQAVTPDETRRALLREGGIRWVLFGPHESELGTWQAGGADYLTPRYRAGAYAVYEAAP